MRKILLGLIGLLFAVPAVAATLPAGYTELEYIESTGTQWIDTGLTRGKFVHDIAFTTVSNYNLMGNAAGAGWYWGQQRRYASGNGYELATNNITGMNSTERRVVEYDNLDSDGITLSAGGQTVTYSTTGTTSTNYSLFRIWDSDQYYVNAKLWGFQAYDANGTPVRNMVPVKRNSDNKVGMYDTVSGQFFTNAGTGDFVAGPAVGIRIATTAYNSARFSPVVTELNTTIATIRSVVTNTINQTKAIADLQATKQTRPNEQCPAGKKCLLVEDDAGQPHWYEIVESAD